MRTNREKQLPYFRWKRRSGHSPHPHLQISHRRSDVALGPFRDLTGDGDGSVPAPGEEGRENLVLRGLKPDRLEAGLEALGQAARADGDRLGEGL